MVDFETLSKNRGQATPANSSVHEKRQDVQFVKQNFTLNFERKMETMGTYNT